MSPYRFQYNAKILSLDVLCLAECFEEFSRQLFKTFGIYPDTYLGSVRPKEMISLTFQPIMISRPSCICHGRNELPLKNQN